jgi:hypothetical protein
MSSVIISGDTSGSVTLSAPAVAGSTTLTLPAATGTVMVSGNMPTFSYYQTSAQTLGSASFTKITFTTNDWDTTGGMYASSKFTPTVAGYYQINGSISINTATQVLISIYKNGGEWKRGENVQSGTQGVGSALVYCNGSTDYVEIYGYVASGQALNTGLNLTYFQGILVRSA